MRENKITFWGGLDTSSRTLEDISPKFKNLWDSGEYRMKPEDIKRMAGYLNRIKAELEKQQRVLSLFEQIPSNAEVVLLK